MASSQSLSSSGALDRAVHNEVIGQAFGKRLQLWTAGSAASILVLAALYNVAAHRSLRLSTLLPIAMYVGIFTSSVTRYYKSKSKHFGGTSLVVFGSHDALDLAVIALQSLLLGKLFVWSTSPADWQRAVAQPLQVVMSGLSLHELYCMAIHAVVMLSWKFSEANLVSGFVSFYDPKASGVAKELRHSWFKYVRGLASEAIRNIWVALGLAAVLWISQIVVVCVVQVVFVVFIGGKASDAQAHEPQTAAPVALRAWSAAAALLMSGLSTVSETLRTTQVFPLIVSNTSFIVWMGCVAAYVLLQYYASFLLLVVLLHFPLNFDVLFRNSKLITDLLARPQSAASGARGPSSGRSDPLATPLSTASAPVSGSVGSSSSGSGGGSGSGSASAPAPPRSAEELLLQSLAFRLELPPVDPSLPWHEDARASVGATGGASGAAGTLQWAQPKKPLTSRLLNLDRIREYTETKSDALPFTSPSKAITQSFSTLVQLREPVWSAILRAQERYYTEYLSKAVAPRPFFNPPMLRVFSADELTASGSGSGTGSGSVSRRASSLNASYQMLCRSLALEDLLGVCQGRSGRARQECLVADPEVFHQMLFTLVALVDALNIQMELLVDYLNDNGDVLDAVYEELMRQLGRKVAETPRVDPAAIIDASIYSRKAPPPSLPGRATGSEAKAAVDAAVPRPLPQSQTQPQVQVQVQSQTQTQTQSQVQTQTETQAQPQPQFLRRLLQPVREAVFKGYVRSNRHVLPQFFTETALQLLQALVSLLQVSLELQPTGYAMYEIPNVMNSLLRLYQTINKYSSEIHKVRLLKFHSLLDASSAANAATDESRAVHTHLHSVRRDKKATLMTQLPLGLQQLSKKLSELVDDVSNRYRDVLGHCCLPDADRQLLLSELLLKKRLL